MPTPSTNAASLEPGHRLARALVQGLDTPLSALRATMESLGDELQHASPRPALRPQRLDGVLREVERLGKNVRELCDLAAPPVPRALPCTLEEIVRAARAALQPEQRERVLIARSEAEATIDVDGPLVSQCLRRLLENALEATPGSGDEPVLVVARCEAGEARFTVVDAAPSALGPGWQPVPFQTTKPNHLGLGLALTQRDVALLAGRLEFLASSAGQTCVRISIPSKGAR